MFPLIFTFPDTSLQVAAFGSPGSSAQNSAPARCSSRRSLANVRQEGGCSGGQQTGSCLGAHVGKDTRCQSVHASLTASLVLQSTPVRADGKQGCAIKFQQRIRKKRTSQPNKQTDHTHHLSGSQLVDRCNERCALRKPRRRSSVGSPLFPCMCAVLQIPQREKAKMVKNLRKSNWRLYRKGGQMGRTSKKKSQLKTSHKPLIY